MTFSVDVLEAMGDALAIEAISHELAHAVLYLRGDEDHWAEPSTLETFKGAERAVDRLLRAWGIDQTDLILWSREWDRRHHPDPPLCIWEN